MEQIKYDKTITDPVIWVEQSEQLGTGHVRFAGITRSVRRQYLFDSLW